MLPTDYIVFPYAVMLQKACLKDSEETLSANGNNICKMLNADVLMLENLACFAVDNTLVNDRGKMYFIFNLKAERPNLLQAKKCLCAT